MTLCAVCGVGVYCWLHDRPAESSQAEARAQARADALRVENEWNAALAVLKQGETA